MNNSATTHTASGVKLPSITAEERAAWEKGVITTGYVGEQHYHAHLDSIHHQVARVSAATEAECAALLAAKVAELEALGIVCHEALRTIKGQVASTYGSIALYGTGKRAREIRGKLRKGLVSPDQTPSSSF